MEDRETAVLSDNNTWNNSYWEIDVPKLNSSRQILKYIILSWYLEEPVSQFCLQERLRERCTQLKLFDYRELLLYTKELFLYALFRDPDLIKNDLFGNILTPGVYENFHYPEATDKDGTFRKSSKRRKKVPDRIVLKVVRQKKASKSAFKRGYNDHGSMATISEKARREANTDPIEHLARELEISTLLIATKAKQMRLLSEMLEGV